MKASSSLARFVSAVLALSRRPRRDAMIRRVSGVDIEQPVAVSEEEEGANCREEI